MTIFFGLDILVYGSGPICRIKIAEQGEIHGMKRQKLELFKVNVEYY